MRNNSYEFQYKHPSAVNTNVQSQSLFEYCHMGQ